MERPIMQPEQSTRISRRRILAMAGASAGTALLGQRPVFADPNGNSTPTEATPGARNTSFASLKHADAGLLNIGYAEAGPANGRPVILLHGWPYDIYSFVDVT